MTEIEEVGANDRTTMVHTHIVGNGSDRGGPTDRGYMGCPRIKNGSPRVPDDGVRGGDGG
ncbi:MAG: hypothetical protein ACOCQ3_05105 [Natronomonas sp.]